MLDKNIAIQDLITRLGAQLGILRSPYIIQLPQSLCLGFRDKRLAKIIQVSIVTLIFLVFEVSMSKQIGILVSPKSFRRWRG